MIHIYIDGDACPVRDEVYRVAERLKLGVFVVTNGSRPIRPPRQANVSLIMVEPGADIRVIDHGRLAELKLVREK